MFSSYIKFPVLILCFQNVFQTISAQENKVQVTFLYDSLCEYCSLFITTQIYDTYSKIGSDFIDLTMVPYGNVQDVKVNGTTIKSCENGPEECYGNKVHGCTLEHNSILDSLGFIYCSQLSSDPVQNSTFQQCAEPHNITWSEVENCLNSGEAETIFEKNGELHKKLAPQYIPYININGQSDVVTEIAAFENLTAMVCGSLEGSSKPSFC